MAAPYQNWFFSEVSDLAERFAQAAKEAREAMQAPHELADASVYLNDAGTELVAQGEVAGYPVAATAPWGFGGDLTDPVLMLIRGQCEQRANSREAGCKLIHIVPRTTERRTAA